jgi:hypothetical protein
MLQRASSPFVTRGALFSIKFVGRDDEHIVALDAHAVQHRADDRAGLVRLVGPARMGTVGFF